MDRVASEQIVDVGERDAEVTGVQIVLVHIASADLPHAAVARRRQLVEAVVATEDQSGRTARLEDTRDERDAVETRDTDRVGLGAGGVAQRTQEVEHSRHAEL